MIDHNSTVDPTWQARVILWMCRIAQTEEEPDVKFRDWLDEAAEGDEDYVLWTVAAWRKVSNMPSFELELVEHQVQHWLRNRAKDFSR